MVQADDVLFELLHMLENGNKESSQFDMKRILTYAMNHDEVIQIIKDKLARSNLTFNEDDQDMQIAKAMHGGKKSFRILLKALSQQTWCQILLKKLTDSQIRQMMLLLKEKEENKEDSNAADDDMHFGKNKHAETGEDL